MFLRVHKMKKQQQCVKQIITTLLNKKIQHKGQFDMLFEVNAAIGYSMICYYLLGQFVRSVGLIKG
jgi:ABC-type antimicrobial peptide transport system permease subunit